ncbi:MAG: uracil-DNA glycosylase family protein [Rhodospirillales bacterium]|nr:uracil-DNA glycosylase family protein [Rhodospirillales bacterium]
MLDEVRACRICAEHLPLGPRPVVVPKPRARILIIGQAPGTRVHETGIPWDDRSGDRLREWMGVDRDIFYGSPAIAVMPMGFCYPGRFAKGGDRPPRTECAPAWHARVLAVMPAIELTLLVGTYAQAYYLPEQKRKSMTEIVREWRAFLPRFLPTPHPSWRTTGWLKRNPWFEEDVLPDLRRRVRRMLANR